MQQALGDVDLESQLAQLQDNLVCAASRHDGAGGRPTSTATSRSATATRSVPSLISPTSRRSSSQLSQDYPGVDPRRHRRRRAGAPARALGRRRPRARCASSRPSSSGRATYAATADGLALTPKALRRLGESALRRIFAQLDAAGTRRPRRPARRAPPTSAPAPSCRGGSATSARSMRSGRCTTPCCVGPREPDADETPAAARRRRLRGRRDRAAYDGRGRAAASTCRSR